jgi:hypothetical protein
VLSCAALVVLSGRISVYLCALISPRITIIRSRRVSICWLIGYRGPGPHQNRGSTSGFRNIRRFVLKGSDSTQTAVRPDKVSLCAICGYFADIPSAQPAKLYRAWMAERRRSFHSYLINDPKLIRTVLMNGLMTFQSRTGSARDCGHCWVRSVF